jgi:hypothetical protein
MTLDIINSLQFKSKWKLVAGRQYEIFTDTVTGKEYVKGTPADAIAVVAKTGREVPMRGTDRASGVNAVCSIHRTYRAIRKPRSSCAQCWGAYELGR